MMRTVPVPGKGLPFLMGALVLVLLQGCLFGLLEEKKNANPDYRRFYLVTVAGSPGKVFFDSTYRINWTPINGPVGGNVSISLYQEDRWIWTLDSSAPNDGEYEWSVSQTKKTLDYRLVAGGNFRVKVASVEDSGAWDFCPFFPMLSSSGASLLVKTPERGAPIRMNRELAIEWSTTLDSATRFGIQLFKDSLLAVTVVDSVTGKNSFVWPRAASPLGAGSGYRFRIFSVDHPGMEAYGPGFTLLPAYEGGFVVTSPKEGDSLRDAGYLAVKWTATGKPGDWASLELQCDFAAPRILDSSTGIPYGEFNWYLRPGHPSAGKCRVRIRSLEDTLLAGYSGYFSIKGVDPDGYEDDDTLSRAKPIEADGMTQIRTLSSRDRDWIRVAVKKDMKYLVPVRSKINLDGVLTDSVGTVITRYSGSAIRVSINPAYTGDYHLSISSSSSYGGYEMALAEFDSARISIKDPFTQPDSNTTWAAGAEYDMKWKPDSLFFGPYLRLRLFRDSTLVSPISSVELANSGRHMLFIPAGFPTSTRYRIRMESGLDSRIWAYSSYFTIKGTVPDAFEPDDLKSTAKVIAADGKSQGRSLTTNDVDWVPFDAEEGKRYLTILGAVRACTVQVYDANGMKIAYNHGTNFSITFTAKASGRHFLRVVGQSPGWIDAYSLSLQGFVAGGSVYPAGFLTPDSSAVWKAADPKTITWKPDTAIFGNSVRLTLEDGSVSALTMGFFPTSQGSAAFNPPEGLVSSGKYRIRMFNGNMSDIFGYSDYFRIDGMAPDSLEPNDSAAAAKPLAAASGMRPLSLHHMDRDWFRVEAKRNILYLAEAKPGPTLKSTVMGLYPNPTLSAISSGKKDSSSLDSLIRIKWVAAADRPYYLSVFSSSMPALIDHGTYDIGLKEYAEADYKIDFGAPAPGDTVVHNDTVSVRWSSRLDLGETVVVDLYKGSVFMQTLFSGAKVSDTYPWKVSSARTPGSDYTLKVRRWIGNSEITAASGMFTISASP